MELQAAPGQGDDEDAADDHRRHGPAQARDLGDEAVPLSLHGGDPARLGRVLAEGSDERIDVDEWFDVIRRAAPYRELAREVVEHLGVRIDRVRHRITLDGRLLDLTPTEFRLLSELVAHERRVLSRDQLLSLTQNRDWDPFDRSIDIRIARLRRKIEDDPKTPRYLTTVRGVGYRMGRGQ